MYSCDRFDAVVYDGAVYCTCCLADDTPREEISPIFADSEWDYYPCCEACGEEHDYVTLTDHGEKYLYCLSEPKPVAMARHENGGNLPDTAWPGGYPIVYQTKDGEVLCPDCANAHRDASDPVSTWHIHYEGEALCCDGCSVLVESAYGVPDSE